MCETPGTIHSPIPKLGAFHKSDRTKKAQEVEDVALGTRVFYRSTHCRFVGIHGYFGGSRRDRENSLLSVSDSFLGHTDGAPPPEVISKTNI